MIEHLVKFSVTISTEGLTSRNHLEFRFETPLLHSRIHLYAVKFACSGLVLVIRGKEHASSRTGI